MQFAWINVWQSVSGLLVATYFCFAARPALADELQPFQSDGCSAFPDGTPGQQELWLECCVAHDYAYWKGGTFEEREAADQALRACVAEVGEPEIAALMLAGVRVGGTPYLPTKFRWGFGWPWPRGYAPLSEAELQQVEALGSTAKKTDDETAIN